MAAQGNFVRVEVRKLLPFDGDLRTCDTKPAKSAGSEINALPHLGVRH